MSKEEAKFQNVGGGEIPKFVWGSSCLATTCPISRTAKDCVKCLQKQRAPKLQSFSLPRPPKSPQVNLAGLASGPSFAVESYPVRYQGKLQQKKQKRWWKLSGWNFSGEARRTRRPSSARRRAFRYFLIVLVICPCWCGLGVGVAPRKLSRTRDVSVQKEAAPTPWVTTHAILKS